MSQRDINQVMLSGMMSSTGFLIGSTSNIVPKLRNNNVLRFGGSFLGGFMVFGGGVIGANALISGGTTLRTQHSILQGEIARQKLNNKLHC